MAFYKNVFNRILSTIQHEIKTGTILMRRKFRRPFSYFFNPHQCTTLISYNKVNFPNLLSNEICKESLRWIYFYLRTTLLVIRKFHKTLYYFSIIRKRNTILEAPFSLMYSLWGHLYLKIIFKFLKTYLERLYKYSYLERLYNYFKPR